jgi:hypothetical protein
LARLQARFHRCIDLSAENWAAALLLGKARERSNVLRRPSSHRGARGNRVVDLQGALGELTLFGVVLGEPDSESAAEYMRSQLFVAGGGAAVQGPDLLFDDDGRDVDIDVKTFDCGTQKRVFAINDDKHAKLAGSCLGYVGLICASFSTLGCLTRLIPYEEVSTWERRTLRPGGSPSRNLLIGAALQQYGVESFSIGQSRESLHDEAVVRELALARGKGTCGSACALFAARGAVS